MSDQSCKNCGYAAFILTPTGRIKAKVHGRCGAPLPDLSKLAIPACTNKPQLTKGAIWPDMGTDCPVWRLAP